MSSNRRIEVVNRQLYKHTHLITDDGDLVWYDTIQRAVKRVGAAQLVECHFYWNAVEVCVHVVKYSRAEIRVKKDGSLLSDYIKNSS